MSNEPREMTEAEFGALTMSILEQWMFRQHILETASNDRRNRLPAIDVALRRAAAAPDIIYAARRELRHLFGDDDE